MSIPKLPSINIPTNFIFLILIPSLLYFHSIIAYKGKLSLHEYAVFNMIFLWCTEYVIYVLSGQSNAFYFLLNPPSQTILILLFIYLLHSFFFQSNAQFKMIAYVIIHRSLIVQHAESLRNNNDAGYLHFSQFNSHLRNAMPKHVAYLLLFLMIV